MNLAVIVPVRYPGITPSGGAESMLHNILKRLVEYGHTVTVYMQGKSQVTYIDGVKVVVDSSNLEAEKGIKECDVVLTHLDGTPMSQSFATRHGKPLAQLIHNTNEFTEGFLAAGADLAIYNSLWVREYHETVAKGPMTKYWLEKGRATFKTRRQTEWRGVTLRPPITMDDYVCPSAGVASNGVDGAITLVNPVPNKGAHIFYALAERNPDLNFMVVKGGYQPNKQVFKSLPNVTVHEHVKDIREVFADTSVVLMPSHYESYGLVAVEAACAGIPSIVSATPGLKEALGTGASYVEPVEPGDFSTVDEWDLALRYVLDDYNFCSYQARGRARELDRQTKTEIIALDAELRRLAGK